MHDSTETRQLLEQVSQGDLASFDRLLDRHREPLRQSVELRLDRRLRTRVDPSDVVQETQVEAFQRLDEYLLRRPMPFRLWLLKTAWQRLAKLREAHIEAGKRTVEREVPMPDRASLDLVQRLLNGSTPSKHLAARELATLVRRALAELPETDRDILVMRYLERLSNSDIGCILELEPGAVSKRHGRALLKLQRILQEQGVGRSDA